MLDFPKRRRDEEERIQFAFMLPNEISAPGSHCGYRLERNESDVLLNLDTDTRAPMYRFA